MFQINAHVFPTETSSQLGKCKGAYAVFFINYADLDGAYALAKYYIEHDGWRLDFLEDEYLIIDSVEDVEQEYIEFYKEALTDGYSLLFNCYVAEDEEETELSPTPTK